MQIARNNNVNTDLQTLMSASKCYVCQGVSSFEALKLSLLSQISKASNPANQTDPQSLLTQANCFTCYSNASIAQLMELSLLNQIAT